MKDIVDQIKRHTAKGLIVRVIELIKLKEGETESSTSFSVGDKIKVSLAVKNTCQFELQNLDIEVNEMSAVKFADNPVSVHIEKLLVDEQKTIVSLEGKVVSNPNDAGSIYEIRDYLCRVMITGDVVLPPIQFEDVELETINILDY